MLYATYAMMLLHTFVGVVLIGIILLQRGRGGGLAGAFGGLGGQSAFGNKAGDVFTRITIVLAVVWMVLGCVCVLMASNSRSTQYTGGSSAEVGTDIKKAPANDEPGAGKGAEKEPEGSLPSPAPENPPKTDSKTDEKAEPKADAKPDAAADSNPKDKDEPKKEEAKKDESKDAPAAAEKKGDAPADSADKKPE